MLKLLESSTNYKKGDYVNFLRTCVVNVNNKHYERKIEGFEEGLFNMDINIGPGIDTAIQCHKLEELLNEKPILIGFKLYQTKVNILLYKNKENGKFVAISKVFLPYRNRNTSGSYTKVTYDTFKELMEGILEQHGLGWMGKTFGEIFKVDMRTKIPEPCTHTTNNINDTGNDNKVLKMDEIIEKIYNNPNIIIIGSGAYDGYKGYYHCIDENIKRELEKESGMSGNYFGLDDMAYYMKKKNNIFEKYYQQRRNNPYKALYVKKKFKWGQGFGMLFSMKDNWNRGAMGIFFIIVPENDKETQKLIEENPEIVKEMFVRKFGKYSRNESYKFATQKRHELNI